MQQGFVAQGAGGLFRAGGRAGIARAEHRADAFRRQFVHLPAGGPGRGGQQQGGIHVGQMVGYRFFLHGQVQGQRGQVVAQALQPRNHPACQHAAGTAEHAGRAGLGIPELQPTVPQLPEGGAA